MWHILCSCTRAVADKDESKHKGVFVIHIKELQAHINAVPRLDLGVWPTPLMPLRGLRTRLEAEGVRCPELWIKREDLTPLGAGGNKVRKLEHVLYKAVHEGADVLLNTGEVQSNQVVQTAAAAAHLGLACELFLGRTDPPLSEDDLETGNIFLCRMLNATVHLVPPGVDRAAAMRHRARELADAGRKPCIIPRGASTAEGAVGSLRCFFELLAQMEAQGGGTPDAIAVTVGSAGTTAGFLVGAQALAQSGGPRIRILAYDSFGLDYPVTAQERILTHAEECWQLLGLPGHCGDEGLVLSYDFVGPGYSRPYPGMIDAVRLLASCEGVVLDPNYTGKSMAGLLDALRKGVFTERQRVVYLHTGGLPALFAMRRHFA